MLNKKLEKFVDIFEQFLDSKGFNIGGDFIDEKQEDILYDTQKYIRSDLKKVGINLTTTQIKNLYHESGSEIYDFIFDEIFKYITNVMKEINRRIGAGLTKDQIYYFIDVLLSGRTTNFDDQLEYTLKHY